MRALVWSGIVQGFSVPPLLLLIMLLAGLTQVSADLEVRCYFDQTTDAQHRHWHMPHRELLRKRAARHLEDPLWSSLAARDLEVASGFLRESGKHRRGSVAYSAAILGALISYSRPFTERPDAVLNQNAAERRCFLSLAADLGADLRLHGMLLQMRDEIIALSDIVSVPVVRVHARRFKYPDPRRARITAALNLSAWRRLAASMQVACRFFQAEMNTRGL